MVPLYYLAKLASEDVKVVLSGQGADELLGGYTRYQAARAISLIRRWGAEKPFAFSLKPFLSCQPALRVAAALSRSDAGGCYSGLTELFTCDEIKRLLGTLSVPEADFELPDTRRDFAGVAMALDARTSLPDELLMYTDKVTMHFSLECRVPFLDLELATFVQALPAAARIGLLQRKKLQHSIARRWLPGVKLPRKKNGFFVPSSSWFGPDSKIRQRLLQTDSAMAGFFDMSEVEKVIRDRDRRAKSDKHLFMLAAIGLWLDRHYRLNPTLVGA
jgi:asparagine synthase (glutamine-hydrolysing)